MLNILLTGSNGQLGSEIKELSTEYSYNFLFTSSNDLDIRNHDKVKDFCIQNNIHTLINCAAYTAVDKAESDEINADLVNRKAVKKLANISKELNIKLIHISTDYVFDGKKIIIREITGIYPNSIISTYSEEIYLYNRSNIAIVENEDKNISLKYILSILNSSLISYYFMKNTAKSVRKMFPKVILKDLRQFPFKEIDKENQNPFIQKADKMLELNKNLQETKQNFLNELNLEKLTKKLQNFETLTFEEFIKEYKKALKLKFADKLAERNFKQEWQALFENDKTLACGIKTEIEQTDKEINKMVYELYGLSDDEIKIVEDM